MSKTLCPKCGRYSLRITSGVCYNCYKKYVWKRNKIICKRCQRNIFHHAKGLCAGCYNFVFKLDAAKASNNKKKYNIEYDLYKEVTKKCVICGFDKVVDLHHLDENRKNSKIKNIIGLCPNHHQMLHNFKYKKQILNVLKEKGYKIKKNLKLEYN